MAPNQHPSHSLIFYSTSHTIKRFQILTLIPKQPMAAWPLGFFASWMSIGAQEDGKEGRDIPFHLPLHQTTYAFLGSIVRMHGSAKWLQLCQILVPWKSWIPVVGRILYLTLWEVFWFKNYFSMLHHFTQLKVSKYQTYVRVLVVHRYIEKSVRLRLNWETNTNDSKEASRWSWLILNYLLLLNGAISRTEDVHNMDE